MPLVIENLNVILGGQTILKNVNLEITDGILTALIGPNGAGKTTLFNVICGQVGADSGEIKYGASNLLNKHPHEIAQLGIARTFQTPREFSELSVLENLMVAPKNQIGEKPWNIWFKQRKFRNQEHVLIEKAWEIIQFLGLETEANRLSSQLSGGQKKLLELGRALMTEPQIILLDEPIAGVNPSLSTQIIAKLKVLIRQGLTLFVIEHNMEFVMQNSDMVHVLAYGEVLVSGIPSYVRSEPRVLEAYLGRDK